MLYGVGLDRAFSANVDALEFEHKPEHDRGYVNVTAEFAAQLFIYAAAELYPRCKNGDTGSLRLGRGGHQEVKVLWRHIHGFGDYPEKRWAFWKDRWTAIASGGGKQCLSGEVRAAAKEALRPSNKLRVSNISLLPSPELSWTYQCSAGSVL